MLTNKLTWNRETKTWLIDGQPSTRKKGQRGVVPVRRRAISERRLLRELKREKEARLRQSFAEQGHTPEKIDLLVYLSTCSVRTFIRWTRSYLRQRALKGKCPSGEYHSWAGGGGFCRKCGVMQRAKGMGKKVTRLARYLGMPRAALYKTAEGKP